MPQNQTKPDDCEKMKLLVTISSFNFYQFDVCSKRI